MRESSDTESNVSGGSRPLSAVSPGEDPYYKVRSGSRNCMKSARKNHPSFNDKRNLIKQTFYFIT